jgi:putative peptidoglycan lipid II flippase
MAYAFALLGWSLIKVLAPGFFARQDTKTPMRTAMWSLGITMGLNLVFVVAAYVFEAIKDDGLHIVLALTNAIGAMCNAYLLYHGLRKQGVFTPSTGWRVLLIRIAIANLAMAACLYFFAGNTEQWLDWRTLTRVWRLALCVGGGAGVYFAALWVAGARIEHFRFHAPSPTTTPAPL